MNAGARGLRSKTWLWALGLCLAVASAFPIAYLIRAEHTPPPVAAAAKSERHSNGVSSLGIIVPDGGVIHVAASYLFGRPSMVEALYVKEGEHVHRGTLL